MNVAAWHAQVRPHLQLKIQPRFCPVSLYLPMPSKDYQIRSTMFGMFFVHAFRSPLWPGLGMATFSTLIKLYPI
jgi:hypothetical protein